MALWTRLREELDHAGRIAQGAVDEGRLRLELYRARQNADRFAQRFGYAVFRAKRDGRDLTAEEYAAHSNNLTAAEAEIARYEKLVDEAAKRRRGSNDAPTSQEP
jgi:hypothetical protein